MCQRLCKIPLVVWEVTPLVSHQEKRYPGYNTLLFISSSWALQGSRVGAAHHTIPGYSIEQQRAPSKRSDGVDFIDIAATICIPLPNQSLVKLCRRFVVLFAWWGGWYYACSCKARCRARSLAYLVEGY